MLVAALVLFAMAVPAAHAAPPTTKAWTVMVYLDADNSLEKLGPTDFVNELCQPGSGSNVNVVTLFDRGYKKDNTCGGWTSTKLFYCTAGETRRRLTPSPTGASATWATRRP